tara:strand:+ start:68 stop:649 length:582 start_codon:yes stop_codon:yes gene_type:complete
MCEMCDAEYINKEQLKVIKLEKLLKKWDDKHFKKTVRLGVWNSRCIEEGREKYYEKMLSKLWYHKSRLQVKNNLKQYYFNKLNELKAIKNNGEGYWRCYIDENIGVFNNTNGCEIAGSECRTFTEFRNEIKTEIINRVDNFMEMPNKDIAEVLQWIYGDYVCCEYTIVYKIRKESRNPNWVGKRIKIFNPNMF